MVFATRSHRRLPRTKEASEYETQVLDVARVTRVVAGGKRLRFRAIVIAGNKKGKVGLGVAKGLDVAQAVNKATRNAQKNLMVVPIVNDTIPHTVEAKVGASHVLLRPQQRGRGLVVGGPVRIICEKAGIRNLSAKFVSSTHNKLNNASATLAALKKLKVQVTQTSLSNESAQVTTQDSKTVT